MDEAQAPDYLQRIRAAQPFRSKSFTRLADYLMDGFVEAAFMTAAQLAHVANVDVGAVVRFAQHLGYRGFPELQADIQTHVRHLLDATHSNVPAPTPFHAKLTAVSQAIESATRRTLPETIRTWQRMLTTARRVILVHRAVLSAPVHRLQMALMRHNVPVLTMTPETLITGPNAIQRDDIVLALESTPQDATMQQALRIARERGAVPTAICPRAASPCALLAERALTAHLQENAPHAALIVAALTLGMAEAITQFSPSEVIHEIDSLSTG